MHEPVFSTGILRSRPAGDLVRTHMLSSTTAGTRDLQLHGALLEELNAHPGAWARRCARADERRGRAGGGVARPAFMQASRGARGSRPQAAALNARKLMSVRIPRQARALGNATRSGRRVRATEAPGR